MYLEKVHFVVSYFIIILPVDVIFVPSQFRITKDHTWHN